MGWQKRGVDGWKKRSGKGMWEATDDSVMGWQEVGGRRGLERVVKHFALVASTGKIRAHIIFKSLNPAEQSHFLFEYLI